MVVEGEREEAYSELAKFFPEVRFVKAEPLDADCASDFNGDRPLGNCIIRWCKYTRSLIPSENPIEADEDERYEYYDKEEPYMEGYEVFDSYDSYQSYNSADAEYAEDIDGEDGEGR